MRNAPRPGWYPDPAGTADHYRWWDGDRWTDHLSASPNAPTPTPLGTPSAVEPDPPRRRSPFRTVVALVVIVALFLTAGAGVGLWLWGGAPNGGPEAGGGTSPSRASTAAASPVGPRGQLDASSRTATIGPASMVLPDEPYTLHGDPVPVSGVFDVAFLAEAEVHRQYDGDHDWSAMVGLTALSPDLITGNDLELAGKQTLTKLAKRMYGGHSTKITNAEWSDRSVDGYPGLELSAQVHYAVDRLPSRYDTVNALLVRLDDGTIVAAVTAVPDGAESDIGRLAAASLNSLTVS